MRGREDFALCENGSTSESRDSHIHKSFEGSYHNTEIVVGLVGAVGTQQKRIVEAISDRLKAFDYHTKEIHVSQDVIGTLCDDIPTEFPSEFERVTAYIDRGNHARQSSGDNSILALGVCSEIFREREFDEHRNSKPVTRIAYIVNSLKHPEEVRRLRRVYSDGFYLIGVYADKETRREYLIRDKGMAPNKADELIRRDEDEVEGHGQHERDTFHLADFFVHLGGNEAAWKHSLWRILDLIFGNPYITPSFDEYAMFMAFASALRSADLSRQIGAVIARDNEIIATGANDCPKPGGGLYWPVYDSQKPSTSMRRRGEISNEAKTQTRENSRKWSRRFCNDLGQTSINQVLRAHS